MESVVCALSPSQSEGTGTSTSAVGAFSREIRTRLRSRDDKKEEWDSKIDFELIVIQERVSQDRVEVQKPVNLTRWSLPDSAIDAPSVGAASFQTNPNFTRSQLHRLV